MHARKAHVRVTSEMEMMHPHTRGHKHCQLSSRRQRSSPRQVLAYGPLKESNLLTLSLEFQPPELGAYAHFLFKLFSR